MSCKPACAFEGSSGRAARNSLIVPSQCVYGLAIHNLHAPSYRHGFVKLLRRPCRPALHVFAFRSVCAGGAATAFRGRRRYCHDSVGTALRAREAERVGNQMANGLGKRCNGAPPLAASCHFAEGGVCSVGVIDHKCCRASSWLLGSCCSALSCLAGMMSFLMIGPRGPLLFAWHMHRSDSRRRPAMLACLGGIGGRCGSGWGSCGVLARKGYSVHEAQSTMPERFVFSCTLFLACHMLLSSCVRKTPSFLLWRGAVLGQEGSEDIAATS